MKDFAIQTHLATNKLREAKAQQYKAQALYVGIFAIVYWLINFSLNTHQFI